MLQTTAGRDSDTLPSDGTFTLHPNKDRQILVIGTSFSVLLLSAMYYKWFSTTYIRSLQIIPKTILQLSKDSGGWKSVRQRRGWAKSSQLNKFCVSFRALCVGYLLKYVVEAVRILGNGHILQRHLLGNSSIEWSHWPMYSETIQVWNQYSGTMIQYPATYNIFYLHCTLDFTAGLSVYLLNRWSMGKYRWQI